MIPRSSLVLLALLATTASAATLPLKPGTYVMAGTPCKDPPFAAMFSYDGHAFRYPHATDCRSVVLSRSGRTYRVRETCASLGDGTPAAPSAQTSSYTILSATRVRLGGHGASGASSYRWCHAG